MIFELPYNIIFGFSIGFGSVVVVLFVKHKIKGIRLKRIGKQFCPECKGKGRTNYFDGRDTRTCQKCSGIGIVDWISNITS